MGANVDYKDLLRFSRRIAKLRTENKEKFFHEAAKMMAARLLSLVIPRTPVGKGTYRTVAKTDKEGNTLRYVRGAKKGRIKTKKLRVKAGGTLRRGWTAKTYAEALSSGGQANTAMTYAQSLDVKKIDGKYQIEVINPVEYASYVEYGHRTRGGKGWVEGQYFLTISEQELRTIAPLLLVKQLEQFLRTVF